MQVILVNPPKIFARSAAGRMVQIAGRPGEVGRFENVVVPNENEIRRLRPAIRFMATLKSEPFQYGTGSRQPGYSEPLAPRETPSLYNRVDNLPLFQKR